MSSKINKATIKIRRDASSTWTSVNPIPKQGEWCLAVDTRELKIGDGSTAWNSLGGITLAVNGNVGIGTTTPTQLLSVNEKSGMTAIGGIAIKLTNKTGSNTVAGQLVQTDTTTNDAFATSAANADDTIGIVVDAGIADGSEAWIVVSGIADVLMDSGGSTRGDRIIASATAGSADVWNVGGAVATHFLEIGHCIETRAGAGLARCILHFN